MMTCTPMMKKIIVIKVIVGTGLISPHFLTPEQSLQVTSIANLLWLWLL